MDINITTLMTLDAFPLSHSRAEGGQNAGQETWQAAILQAEETPLLNTPEKLQAMRDFARSSGGWNEEEISAWSDQEINALFLQWIAGDIRECPRILEGITFEGGRIDGTKWYYEEEKDCGEFETGPFDSRTEAYWNHADSARPPRAESLEEIDWDEYETQASAGHIPGNLFRARDGQVYFSLCE